MSHDHRSTDFDTLMYTGDPFASEITAVYLDGASEVLIRERGQGSRRGVESWGKAKKLVEVDGPLTEQQFTEIAQNHGALNNSLGYMTGPGVGHMALSDAGSIIIRNPIVGGDHIAFPPIGQQGPNWRGLGSYGPRRDFHDTAAENFGMYHAHQTQETNPAVLQSRAQWLGEDVVKYLTTAKSPDPAPEPHPLAVHTHPGLQAENVFQLPTTRTTWRPK